jgi:alpha-tubulin suppressor-like RCC1 family protein
MRVGSLRIDLSALFVAALLWNAGAAHADGGGFVDLAGGRAVDVAVGSQGACAVTDAGRLICWGNNKLGTLGPVKQIDRLPPTVRPDVTDAVRVFLEYGGGCVARRSGEITCWGRTEQNRAVPFLEGGPRGSPTSFGVARNHACGIVGGKVQCWGSAAYRVPVVRDPVQVATGPFKNCARDRGGAVWWWGSTDGGIDTSQPLSGKLPARRVQGIEHAVDVSIAATHGCAVVASGKVECWSAATAGHEAKAEPIAGIDDAIAVDANSLCAIRRGGGVACWQKENIARPWPNLADVAQLATRSTSTCARLTTGAVLCLGSNESRELGIETHTESTTPVRVPGVDAVGIAAGYANTCALARGGGLVCWGAASVRPRTPFPPEAIRPRPLPGARDLVQVSAGGSSYCALTRARTVSCWTDGLEPAPSLTAKLGKALPILSVEAGAGGACAVTIAGDVFCPGEVEPARGSVQAVGGGADFGCALKSSGQVICWGDKIPARETPHPGVRGWSPPGVSIDPSPHVVTMPPVRQLAAGGGRLCAVMVDGHVFCPQDVSQWKYISTPTPFVQIGPVRSISVGHHQTCAILDSGQVACWGQNDHGELGIGTLGPWPYPADRAIEPVVGLDHVVALSAGGYHTCAVRADGAVFCWGSNWAGQLGLGTIGFRATP